LAQTVLIDCGNSRLKHARANATVDMQAIAHDFLGQSSPDQSISDQSIPDQSIADHSSAGQSASTQKWLASLQQCVSDQAALGPVSALAFCNVAGDSAEFMRHVQHTFPAARCYELRAKAKIHRWRSSYAQPEKLGADRIAAMLGAIQRQPQQRVLVVVAGTALTLDVVDANGLHLGGLIAPGPDLMQRALQNNTAQLRASASSAELALANSTQSAIANASVWSSVALIQSVANQHPSAHCVLSGGAASALSAHLPAFEVAPSLVLEGLAAWLLFTSK
jgi:type III pantothenate kinase